MRAPSWFRSSLVSTARAVGNIFRSSSSIRCARFSSRTFLNDQIGNVMLLVAFEDDVVGYCVRLERRVEDMFFDRFVDAQSGGQGVQ
jgi:hypothetical protein